jgi:hypothetical protein
VTRLARAALALVVGLPLGWFVAHRVYGARHRPEPLWPAAVVLHVPHVQGSIVLDGDSDDSGWRGPIARTHAFVGKDGVTPAHPFSEARLVWGDGFLYMNLYAADEDIHTTAGKNDTRSWDADSFHVGFSDGVTEHVLDFSPLGAVKSGLRPAGTDLPLDASWESHVHVSHEIDGTPDHSGDHDEEWVLELALPFESIGLRGAPGDRIGLSMRRCDTPMSGTTVCGTWGQDARRAVIVLD